MNFENYFPLWNDLNTAQKKIISDNLITQYVKKGTIIHNGNLDCTGLLLVKSGQLRTYILSDEGREITLYRLFDMDICLLSASCIIPLKNCPILFRCAKRSILPNKTETSEKRIRSFYGQNSTAQSHKIQQIF